MVRLGKTISWNLGKYPSTIPLGAIFMGNPGNPGEKPVLGAREVWGGNFYYIIKS